MKKLNKKGFTLIELLAVIIILGVLLLIAVPSVSKYIEQSKQDAYVTNVKNFVDAVRTDVAAGTIAVPAGECRYVKFESITLEKGSNTKSPYGDYEVGYVKVVNNNGTYTYTAAALDDQGRGFVEVDVNGVDADNKPLFGRAQIGTSGPTDYPADDTCKEYSAA